MAEFMHDMELVRRYAEAKDQEAFAQLVRRHGDWVYLGGSAEVGG